MPGLEVSRSRARNYLPGVGLGIGKAKVADTEGIGDVDPAGDGEEVADGLGDGVGVGLG